MGAGVGHRDQKALIDKLTHRLAQRTAAYAELFREVCFDQLRPGLNVPVQNGGTQAIRDVRAEGRFRDARERPDTGGSSSFI
ncbi:hypothetical protein GCM10007276_21780 [Agaricicola taiwanensis]|uniref:Uncharacterized protein n=1 Tax=Agaricicola taiwanensis TaxID=591372 RepID=A0A8J2YI13_9RHOB|nr:hypothetical protein GCM10007276_21780 [Agaricicola taiwanensis]